MTRDDETDYWSARERWRTDGEAAQEYCVELLARLATLEAERDRLEARTDDVERQSGYLAMPDETAAYVNAEDYDALAAQNIKLEAERDLLREHLRAVTSEAIGGGQCRMCGEVFDDSTTMGRPCTIPDAVEFLEDPTGTIEAVLAASQKGATDGHAD